MTGKPTEDGRWRSKSGLRAAARRGVTCILVACGIWLTSGAGPGRGGELDPQIPAGDRTELPVTLPLRSRIDARVLRANEGVAALPATAAEFFRRLHLDLLGRPPRPGETGEFLARVAHAEPTEAEWESLVERLLGSDEFTDFLALRLDLWLMERRGDRHVGGTEWRAFLRQSALPGSSLQELMQGVLAADGESGPMRPAAKFYLDRNAEWALVARDVSRVFLGRDTQCAQCHDHPLISDYRQDEFQGVYAFLHRSEMFVDERQDNRSLLGEKAVGRVEFASVFTPQAAKAVAVPSLPGYLAVERDPLWREKEGYVTAPAEKVRGVPLFSLRRQLAALTTDARNLSFNRNLANRLWAMLFGRGLVEPVDEHHGGNPPIHAELLQDLADFLAANRYDPRAFFREVTLSQAYRRSSAWQEDSGWMPCGGDRMQLTEAIGRDESQLEHLQHQLQSVERELAAAELPLREARERVVAVESLWVQRAGELRPVEERLQAAGDRLPALREELERQKPLVAILQTAAAEAVKVVAVVPDDAELSQARATLESRSKTALEKLTALEAELAAIEKQQADDRSSSERLQRELADLRAQQAVRAEFATEARGVLRHLHERRSRLQDRHTDLDHHRSLLRVAFQYAEEQANGDGTATVLASGENLRNQLRWRLAVRPLRPLMPEQMAATLWEGLELAGAFEKAAANDWDAQEQAASEAAAKEGDSKSEKKPESEAERTERRRQAIATSVAQKRNELLGRFVSVFAAAGGTPQDGFEASVDQALFLANDPAIQQWMQAGSETLFGRLRAISDPTQVTRELYAAVLGRWPDAEESAAVVRLLEGAGDQRDEAIREVAWGLVASLEFRFMP